MKGASPGRRGEPARERVARVAKALFVAKGFEGVSIDEIARRARVSKPTIYAHFGGKERLFMHILERACERLIAPLVSEAAKEKPIGEVLHAHAKHYARAVLDPEVIALHRLFVAEAVRFPEMSRRYYEQGPATAHRALATFLADRASAGEIRCADADTAAVHYASLIIAAARSRLLFRVDEAPDWARIDAQSALAVDLFLAGLGAAALKAGAEATAG